MSYQERISSSFAKAAIHYDQLALLQRQSMVHLVRMIPPTSLSQSLCLDIGGGTGELETVLQRVYGLEVPEPITLDWAAPMLMQAQRKGGGLVIQADMHRLPIRSASVELILSNFALQWCLSPRLILTELLRILRPHGVLMLAIPVLGSLSALSAGWRAAGLQDPVNRLFSQEEWLNAADTLYLDRPYMHLGLLQVQLQTAREGLAMLSVLGASAQPEPRKGLLGRKSFLKAVDSWKEFSGGELFLVEYRVLWLCLSPGTFRA